MSVFKSETLIPITVTDSEPVARELAAHFEQRGYQVECSHISDSQWEVGITRGGMFKAAVGLKSAMKVQLEVRPTGTMVRAGAGIFGMQAVPTAITLFVAWPVLLTQVWGLIREAELDDEAVRVVEMSLKRLQRLGSSAAARSTTDYYAESLVRDSVPNAPAASAVPGTFFTATATVTRPEQGDGAGQGAFCPACGRQLEEYARFCAGCGQAQSR